MTDSIEKQNLLLWFSYLLQLTHFLVGFDFDVIPSVVIKFGQECLSREALRLENFCLASFRLYSFSENCSLYAVDCFLFCL